MANDLRYALRMLYRSPGFTAVAVLSLALGIGANTAIFSLVDAVLLRPLPYEQPSELVQVYTESAPGRRNTVSPGAFLDWKAEATVFEGLSLRQDIAMNLTGTGEPERLRGLGMSAGGLQILRARPELGRTFAPDEDQPGKDKVVVLTHELWQRRFDGRTSIIGEAIQLSDQSYTVIGVMPARFLPWDKAEFVVPTAIAPKDANQRSADWLNVVGRLKTGVGVKEANAAMGALAARLAPLYPADKRGWGIAVVPLHEVLTGRVKPALIVLLGAVVFVMLIACVNVANLLLARGSGREREMGIRAALGGSRGRVVRQLLTESVVLSATGGVLGVALAWLGIEGLSRLAGENLPRAQGVGIDPKGLGFAMSISLASAALFGLAPAIHASRPNLNNARRGGTRNTGGIARSRARGALIVAEVAVSLVLLTGAGLLMKSFARLSDVAPGIDPRNALTMDLSLPKAKYPNAASRAAFLDQALERIASLPGVQAAGATEALPLVDGAPTTSFTVAGRAGQPEQGIDTDFDYCSSGYFLAAGIPLRSGKFFDERDAAGRSRTAIVNEAFVREHFPGENPLGKRIHLDVFTGKIDEGWEIAGVVGDVHQRTLQIEPRPCVYRPQRFGTGGGPAKLIIRTAGAPLASAQGIRKAILDADPDQPVSNVRTMDDVMAETFAQRRFTLIVLGGFAGAGLLLAAIGLYGMLAYGVSERVREIGVRMALGAQRNDVLCLVVVEGLKPAGIGIAVGLLGAFGLNRWLAGMLYEVKPSDPSVFAGTSLLLLAVALLASWLPARRAARMDPMAALRNE